MHNLATVAELCSTRDVARVRPSYFLLTPVRTSTYLLTYSLTPHQEQLHVQEPVRSDDKCAAAGGQVQVPIGGEATGLPPRPHARSASIFMHTSTRLLGNYGGHFTRLYLDLTCVLLTVPVF